MKTFTVHTFPQQSHSNYDIKGETLADAIPENFQQIAQIADIGNAAGYKLNHVEARYAPGILGGKGGVELTIKWHGQDLAHKPASQEVQTTIVWIYARKEDMLEPHVFTIG